MKITFTLLFAIILSSTGYSDRPHFFVYTLKNKPNKVMFISNEFDLIIPDDYNLKGLVKDYKTLLDKNGHLKFSRAQDVFLSGSQNKSEALKTKAELITQHKKFGYKIVLINNFFPTLKLKQ